MVLTERDEMEDAEIRQALKRQAEALLDLTRDLAALEVVALTAILDGLDRYEDKHAYLHKLRERTMDHFRGVGKGDAGQVYADKVEGLITKLEGAVLKAQTPKA